MIIGLKAMCLLGLNKGIVMTKKYFYDPSGDREWYTENPLASNWIRITETQNNALLEARRNGGLIFVNASESPDVFYTPPMPAIAWNEIAELSPFTVINGVPNQVWMVSKKSIAAQGKELAKLRWGIQNTGLLYQDISGSWQLTRDVAVTGGDYIPTDTLTMTTLIGIKSDFDMGINTIRRWKVCDLRYVYYTNEQLVNAYKLGQQHWQLTFDIEAAYGEAIVKGLDVNIYEWQLLQS